MPLLAHLCRDYFELGRIEAMAAGLGLDARHWHEVPAGLPSSENSWFIVDLLEPNALELACAARDAGWRVLAYGPHVRGELFAAAREAGLEACARSALDRVLAGRAC
ncbi:MAG: hypothetical protein VKO64_04580 [Candidatus Sericytochromatia bacterium]|nr:hypothetical protein [Candidatus Sericytochromatia bacterium]